MTSHRIQIKKPLQRLPHFRAVHFWLILPMLAACSPRHRLANQHLERGEFEAASIIYSRLIKEDPKDTRAIAGIRRAREGFIGDRLIAIRFARLGQNCDQALDMLRQVVEDENLWAVYPTGAVYTTQRDETTEGYRHFSRKLEALISAGKPVPAKLYIEKFKAVFWQGDKIAPLQRFTQRVTEDGRLSCMGLASAAPEATPYYRDFIRRYCQYWGQEGVLANIETKGGAHEDLFSEVSLDNRISGLPSEAGGSLIQDLLQRALETSPFFDARSLYPVHVWLGGHFKSVLEETKITLEHPYKEREEYTAIEEIKGQRRVPFDEVIEISSSPPRTTTRTQFRTEEYSEKRPVTKTRYISKTRQILGTQYKQDLALLIEGNSRIGDHNIRLNISGAEHREGVSHDQEIPDIGLRRKPKKTVETMPWLTGKLDILRSSFAAKLEAQWFDLYCSPDTQQKALPIEEMVHRCRKSKRGSESEFVARWFKSRLGISPSETGVSF